MAYLIYSYNNFTAQSRQLQLDLFQMDEFLTNFFDIAISHNIPPLHSIQVFIAYSRDIVEQRGRKSF